ncbi:MAG: DUF1501 domain-containing protein [Planctomycetota bacterium]|nr:DUF1501 domain-containing protein [Planctomycetota bacterium]
MGSLGLGGLSLSNLLAVKALAAGAGGVVRDKSVVFLFMHGGPSQTETFDPKMSAPAGVRSVTGEVKTSLPGVTYGATFEKLARLAHKVAVVRSFTTGNANHDIKPIVCKETLGANIGSLYARVAGTNHPVSGMPRNVALFPRAVEPKSQERVTQFGKFDSTGSLGAGYTPFIPGGSGDLQQDMQLNLPRGRLDDRRGLLSRLDQLKKSLDGNGEGLDRFRQQAFDALLGGVGDAFDLSKEDPKLVERYDTAPLVRPDQIGRQWNNYNNYVDNARTLGKLMLMARRLCERGCGFVTVTTNFVWDMHADENNATVQEGMQYCGLPFDHAVSTFLQDVEERGLSDDILLVACGEMGRTPKLNARGGRDHWGGIAPLLIAGGGLKMGQVIGESNRDASRPAADPITNKDLVATILHSLFNVEELRITQGIPAELVGLTESGKPIRELF